MTGVKTLRAGQKGEVQFPVFLIANCRRFADVALNVQGREKIGVVGRTGNSQRCNGAVPHGRGALRCIFIDGGYSNSGVSDSQIVLHSSPVPSLFEGSIRYNLDCTERTR